jgi:hypothetical protein
MALETSLLLETVGIDTLAKERPDILAVIINENFLPPPQLVCAIQALERGVLEKEKLEFWLRDLLHHYSSAVRRETYIALNLEEENELA